MPFPLSKQKFSSFPLQRKHKVLARILKQVIEGQEESLEQYQDFSEFLALPLLHSKHREGLCDRYYYHTSLRGMGLQEAERLAITSKDQVSDAPFLPVDIILDRLRSAANMGNILRTIEALRLGRVLVRGNILDPKHPKVLKTSRGAVSHLNIEMFASQKHFHRPLVVLETGEHAVSLCDFVFPEKFTLVVGNEEEGVSQELLEQADHLVKIPLVGVKQALNVSSAFSMAAFAILKQFTDAK